MCKQLPCGCTPLVGCPVAAAMATEAEDLFVRRLPAHAEAVIRAYNAHRAALFPDPAARLLELN